MNDNLDMLNKFARASEEFFSGGLNLQFIPEFTESTNKIPGVKSEHCIIGDKLVFHFWADPKFPDKFDDQIKEALSKVQCSELLVEYVPEVSSWYTHLTGLPLGPSAELAERLIQKIRAVTVS